MKWFHHDTDTHRNRKIRKLIRVHGATGYAFWFLLLEKLYAIEGDFSISADELWFEDVSEDLRLGDYRTPIRILDTMAEAGLIDKQLWAEHIIYAPAIAERGDQYIVKRVQEREKKRKQRAAKAQKRNNQGKFTTVSPGDTVGTKGQVREMSPSDTDTDSDTDPDTERVLNPQEREKEEKSLTQTKVFCDETNVSTEQPTEPIDAEIINTTPVNNQDSGGDKSSATGAIAISNNSQYSSVQQFEFLMSVTAETHPWRFANRDELRLFRQYLANTSLKFIKDKNERIGTARQWLSNASSAVPGDKRYTQVYDAWEDWLDSLETATHIDDVTAASKDSTRRMLSRFSEYQKNREAELAEKRRAHEELLERSRRENT